MNVLVEEGDDEQASLVEVPPEDEASSHGTLMLRLIPSCPNARGSTIFGQGPQPAQSCGLPPIGVP